MDLQRTFYPETRFGGFTDIDGTIAFYTRVNALIEPSSVVLDVGCGRGEYGEDAVSMRRNIHILKGKCRKVIGIDVDKNSMPNPYIDEFRMIGNGPWPIEDASIDVCVSDNVLEHVENPETFMKECSRVLKKGGYLCIRTPNLLSYFGIISRLIPNKYHTTVLSRAQRDRKEEDVFPTVYRCNTVWRLRAMFRKYGLEPCVYGYEAEPSYLSFSKLMYLLGVLHQKLMPGYFKLSLFAFGKKN